jgi:hypothetical protein
VRTSAASGFAGGGSGVGGGLGGVRGCARAAAGTAAQGRGGQLPTQAVQLAGPVTARRGGRGGVNILRWDALADPASQVKGHTFARPNERMALCVVGSRGEGWRRGEQGKNASYARIVRRVRSAYQ